MTCRWAWMGLSLCRDLSSLLSLRLLFLLFRSSRRASRRLKIVFHRNHQTIISDRYLVRESKAATWKHVRIHYTELLPQCETTWWRQFVWFQRTWPSVLSPETQHLSLFLKNANAHRLTFNEVITAVISLLTREWTCGLNFCILHLRSVNKYWSIAEAICIVQKNIKFLSALLLIDGDNIFSETIP